MKIYFKIVIQRKQGWFYKNHLSNTFFFFPLHLTSSLSLSQIEYKATINEEENSVENKRSKQY
jgi:hypothetical protein